MFIRMLGTHAGSPNGIEIREYLVGEIYEVPAVLGQAFVEHLHWAERFSPTQDLERLREMAQAQPLLRDEGSATAMVAAAPANKMLLGAPANKIPRPAAKKAPGRPPGKGKRR